MNEYVLSIDVGTTSVKVLLLSTQRKITEEISIAHNLISLHPNWAEEDADIWWEHTLDAMGSLLQRKPEYAMGLRAVGVSGMVPAIVLLDKAGNVLRSTIQQNDARAIRQIEALQSQLDQKRLFALTGGFTNQQHILPRLLWIKENEPDIWEQIDCVMGSYDFVTYRLTGTKSLEMNWAVESGCFDIRERKWLTDQFRSYEICEDWFPPVHMPMDIVGVLKQHLCQRFGIRHKVSVIAGSADHVASTLAAGIIEPGNLLIKFGGAGDILYCTDTIKPCEKLFFDYHDIPGQYLLNGCMAASGSLLKWFVNDILDEGSDPNIYPKLDEEAAAIPPGAEGLIILPYFLGEKTPIFDPTARGILFGLTLSHKRGHIFRAILEAVIYGFRHHIDVLREMDCVPNRIFATNGGAKSKFWCQIAADILGQPVTSFPHHPGSSLGVGFLAGLAVGIYTDWSQICDFLEEKTVFQPIEKNQTIYERSYRLYRELYKQTKPNLAAVQQLYRP